MAGTGETVRARGCDKRGVRGGMGESTRDSGVIMGGGDRELHQFTICIGKKLTAKSAVRSDVNLYKATFCDLGTFKFSTKLPATLQLL